MKNNTMTATVTLYWQRRYLYRQRKPWIAARTYHVRYDGTLKNLLAILQHTLTRRERLKLVIIDGKQLVHTPGGYQLNAPPPLPEVQKQYPDSYLPVVRPKRNSAAAPL